MTKLEYIRHRIASWIAPDLAGYKKLYENAAAENEGSEAIIRTQDSYIENLVRANNEYNARLSAAGLRLSAQGTALKKALAYIYDAKEAVEEELKAAKSAKRKAALTATLQAVEADLKYVQMSIDGAAK